MESAKEIVLDNQSLIYLIRHFSSIDEKCKLEIKSQGFTESDIQEKLSTIGSKFNTEFAKNPGAVVVELSKINPAKVINQGNQRTALIYEFTQPIGCDSICSLDDIPPSFHAGIQKVMRGDYLVQSIELSTFLTTNQLVAVVENETNKLITLFPGRYAPPFPNDYKSENERKNATKFWEQHLFIKPFTNE